LNDEINSWEQQAGNKLNLSPFFESVGNSLDIFFRNYCDATECQSRVIGS